MNSFASFNNDLIQKAIWIRASLGFHFIVAAVLMELTVSFIGKEGFSSNILGLKQQQLQLVWRILPVVMILATVFTRWFTYVVESNELEVVLTHIGEVLFAVLFGYYLLTSYAIEKLFRNMVTMQKRIFMLFLSSVGVVALGSMILLIRFLFFRVVSFEFMQLHAALCAVFFPGILIGLFRYRLWQEQIVIGRGIVYTSITILFFGLFLVFLGIVAAAVKVLGVRFNEFETFVILFILLFLGISTIFSPHMRKAITAFTRKYIYKAKYDYRDQLLRLHNAHQTTGNVEKIIKAFVDNLKYTIIVDNAIVFIRSPNENYFSWNEPDGAVITIRANSPLVDLFETDTVTAIDVANSEAIPQVATALNSERETISQYALSHLFAIRYQKKLAGILAIKAGKRLFDSEDYMLIDMFCESIGMAIFRDRLHREHIEQKQFESFSHMASFIVHDIKNQVATLTLLTKNAKENISNPAFQPVLLRSLENTSSNLNALIQKLQSPPKKDKLSLVECDCNTIVETIVDHTKAASPEGIKLRASLSKMPFVVADATALTYVLKNLMVNAIEALGSEGRITCSTGAIDAIVHDDTYHFGLTADDRESHHAYIMVEDNGPGMSREFLQQRLFKPFNTTKDKGVGIGLYQCKTLVEGMGGKLFCWSAEGKGTRFCILL